ncbi:hypothetical protein ACSBLW_09585 [Thioclava sp. FR2]|uniref:hypothetical protein n=1 Tax=Thioclava sp. FR2 TaxID=3445780 RepID=UPI003EC0732A
MKRFLRLAPLVLVACGPIPVEQAERQCLERARLAQQPRGAIGVGMDSSGKARGNFEVTVTSDYIMGRDPSAVYDFCVQQKSGQAPTRPLYSFPEWKG